MAPLKGEFAEVRKRTKYRNKKNLFLEDLKETPLETSIPIHRGRGSAYALNALSKQLRRMHIGRHASPMLPKH